MNIKTHDLGQQEQRADRQVFVSFTSLFPTPMSAVSVFTSYLPLSSFLLATQFCPFLLPLLSLAFYSGTYLQKPYWWLKWGWITHTGLCSYSPLRSFPYKLQNKLRTKEGFIPVLLIHEIDIHQHGKFRPEQGLLLHLLYICSLLRVETPCQ